MVRSMARKFFYICTEMFLLALSFYFGASTAAAQFGVGGGSMAIYRWSCLCGRCQRDCERRQCEQADPRTGVPHVSSEWKCGSYGPRRDDGAVESSDR